MNTRKRIGFWPLIAALTIVLLLRLITLGSPDLVDTTEGRYATMAKLMLEKDDWVTPWGVFKGVEEPYLGKPPLHFWLMQVSYLALGINNFSARLPGVLTGLLTCLLVAVIGNTRIGAPAGLVAALILATSTLFFFLSGGCVLDVTLTLGITLALVSFALADRSRWWGYLCFVGLGIGVLVKGPLAVVLAGLTVVPWIALRRIITGTWPVQVTKLPLISGTSIFLAIVAPWYLWAEARNPGFLNYFIFTENLGRYLKTDYGDKYGSGHVQPMGTVWLMMIPAIFPWVLVTLSMSGHFLRRIRGGAVAEWLRDEWLCFFAFWTLGCPALLTLATQYTGTYLVPVLPGFALLAALVWARWEQNPEPAKRKGVTLLKTVSLFLSTLATAGSVISLWFEGTGANATFAFAVGALLFAFSILWTRRTRTSPALLSMIAIYTAITYSLTVLCFDNYISNSRSTWRILTLAASLTPPGEEVTVAFRGGLPFSASFYKDLIAGRSIVVSGVHDDLLSSSPARFIAARKGAVITVQQTVPDAKAVGNFGKWFLFEKPPETNKP